MTVLGDVVSWICAVGNLSVGLVPVWQGGDGVNRTTAQGGGQQRGPQGRLLLPASQHSVTSGSLFVLSPSFLVWNK